MADTKQAEMETEEESNPTLEMEKIQCDEVILCAHTNHRNSLKLIDGEGRISPHPHRPRTYSAGQIQSMTLNVDCCSSSPSPISVGSPAPRVIQIRREESVDELTREVAKERDVTNALNLSRSWDELSWLGDKNYAFTGDSKRDSMDEIIFNSVNPAISSPVRFIDKAHFNRSLTPSPITVPISPKQRTFRRSLSPSSLRPSLLTSKRKLDPDDPDSCASPVKRSMLFYSPSSTLSSVSSNSSPDHNSDHNSDTNSNHRLSNDEDSGSENTFVPHSINSPVNSPLSCDTRPLHSFAFVKPRYVAPQSPLAAGVNSASLQSHPPAENSRKTSLTGVGANYTFTSVKE